MNLLNFISNIHWIAVMVMTISIIWIVPAMSGTYLFANRSIILLAIDAGMYIVLFSVSGFILGIW